MQKYISLKVQMAYVALTGLQLIFAPNFVLKLVGIEPTLEIWIRILGVIVSILAILYFGILENPNKEIIKYTIYGRFIAAFAIIILGLKFGPKTLVLFALVDIVTAIWTSFELKK